jgi:hypothetical protein
MGHPAASERAFLPNGWTIRIIARFGFTFQSGEFEGRLSWPLGGKFILDSRKAARYNVVTSPSPTSLQVKGVFVGWEVLFRGVTTMAESEGTPKSGVDASIIALKKKATDLRGQLLKSAGQRRTYGGVVVVCIVVLAMHYYGHPARLPTWLVAILWVVAILLGLAFVGVAGDVPKLRSQLADQEDLVQSLMRLAGLEKSEDYFDVLVQINVTNLKEYYLLVKLHTQKSFLASLAAGGVGLAFIAASLVAGSIKPELKDISYVTAGAGVFTEFISGVFFYLYSKTVRQLKEYHDSLLDVQNVLLSFKLIEGTQSQETRAAMIGKMIEFLVGGKTMTRAEDSRTGVPLTGRV